MELTDVVDLYRRLRDAGIQIWLDGGWGVDALLGEQTRPHDDVDIVVQNKDVPRLRKFLEARRYRDVEREDTSAWNFVLGDDEGRQVDVHVITLDEKGNGLYGPPEQGVMYPASSLTGTGVVGGLAVRCISPYDMVRFHSGYKLRDKDFHDVLALCRRFGIELPPGYSGSKE